MNTKAQTLKSLYSKLKKSMICESFIFTVNEWNSSQGEIIQGIQSQFINSNLIIRSSALNEDGLYSSMAGAFDSVKDIKLLGFDGRVFPGQIEESEKITYPHYRGAVYPSQVVDSIHGSRPGYYDEDFSNHRKLIPSIYESYNSDLESIIDKAELLGFQIETLKPSNLTALKDKFHG